MVPARLPRVTRTFLGGFVRARANALSEVEKVRQRRITGQSSGDHAKESRKPLREVLYLARMAQAPSVPGRWGNSAFAVTTIHLHHLLLRADGRGGRKSSGVPAALLGWREWGKPQAREQKRTVCVAV
jgi:hypothetical protein